MKGPVWAECRQIGDKMVMVVNRRHPLLYRDAWLDSDRSLRTLLWLVWRFLLAQVGLR